MKDKDSIVYSEIQSKPAVLREADVSAAPVVTVRDAKSHLSALLDWVSGGREITITSDGKPKARLVPVSPLPERKLFRGMGRFLSGQPIHSGPSAEQLIRDDRDGRGW
ncbi:MAG: type II toxin-antitoxin system Phd/YefM family antitoxin [Limisphaerales bacterium]